MPTAPSSAPAARAPDAGDPLHERYLLAVCHPTEYDGDFDMIGSLTGQPTRWVVPPGAADN